MPDYIIYAIKHETIPRHGHLYYTLSVPTAENNPVIPTVIESESDSEYDYETSGSSEKGHEEKKESEIKNKKTSGKKKVVPNITDKEKEILRKKQLKKEKEERKTKELERLKKKLNSPYVTENNIDKRSTFWKFEELKRDCMDPSCYNYNSEICQEMRKDINSWKLVKLQTVSGLHYKQEIAKEVLRQREKTGYTLKKYNELLGEVFLENCKHYIPREKCDICKYKCKHCRNLTDCIFCMEGEKPPRREEREMWAEINKIKLKLRELANENKAMGIENKRLTLENKEMAKEIKRMTRELKVKISEELKEEERLKKENQKKAKQEKADQKLRELHKLRLQREKAETLNQNEIQMERNEVILDNINVNEISAKSANTI